MHNALEKSHPHIIPPAWQGVHEFIVDVVLPQPKMIPFTIMIDLTFMTLRPSCWRRSGSSGDLLRLNNAHGFIHDARKHYGDLILHFTWVGWRHCVCVKRVEMSWWEGGGKIWFFGIFSRFFRAIMVKTTSFSIQMIKFEFKRNTWTNQEPPPSYNLTALAAGGL
jgi:hypothetical protein